MNESTQNPANPGKPASGDPATGAATRNENRNERKTMRGRVVANKMQKTVVVQVDRKVRHPVYEKFVSRSTKLYVHDENREAQVGDMVEVVQTRPLSKLKRWRLVKILQKASKA